MNQTCRILAVLVAAGLSSAADKPGKRAKVEPVVLGVKTAGVRVPYANLTPEASFALESAPAGILFTPGLAIADSAGVHWFDAKTNAAADKPASEVKIDKPCAGLLNAFGAVWAPSCATGELVKSAKPGGGRIGSGAAPVALTAIAASADSVWMLADAKSTLLRIDPKENAIAAEIRLPVSCNSIVFAESALWVTCPGERLLRIDPRTNLIDKRIEVAADPVSVTAGEGSIWVLGRKEGKISRVDPKTNKVIATVELEIPNAEGMLAFGGGYLWASVHGFPLTRIVPATDKVAQQFPGAGGGRLWFGLGSLWLGSAESKTVARIDPKRVLATLPD